LRQKNVPATQCKFTALLEVLGIFVVGNYAAYHLGAWLAVPSIGSIIGSALNSAKPSFVTLSFLWLQAMCIQYACLSIPPFAIGWWRRRWGVAHYGITKGGKSLSTLIPLALITFALVALPNRLLWVARRFVPLGPEPAFRALLGRQWTPSFWLFLAVSSFAVMPVLEELFFRGYCQKRLEEDFGGVGAIVIVTLFMTLGHNQYYQWSVLSTGQVVTLVPMVLGMGYVFWRSPSIVPAVILHAAVNVPTKGIYDFLLPAAMVVSLVLLRRSWWSEVQKFCRAVGDLEWKMAVLGGALFAVAMTIGFEAKPNVFVPLAFFCLAVALISEYRDRRRLSQAGNTIASIEIPH